jgi:CRISPR-associated protein Cmr1
MTKMAEPLHKKALTIPNDGNEIAFPRAQFGLPIITKFKCGKGKQGEGLNEREPYTTQLVPEGRDRLASPLVLKTIAINEKEGFGAIVVLVQPPIKKLKLKIVPDNNASRQEKDHAKQIDKCLEGQSIEERHIYPDLTYTNINNNPMRQSGVNTISAIEAFLASEEVQETWKNQGKCQK